MSEQQTEQTSGKPGSVGAESTVPSSSDSLIETVMASVREAQASDAPALAPDQLASKVDPAKVEAPRVEAPSVEAPATDGTRQASKILIMSPRDRRSAPEAESADAVHPRHRIAAMVAVAALAIAAGALGGAFATAWSNRMTEVAAATPGSGALEAAVARIDADILALKAGLQNASRLGMSQFNKTNDRLDKIEKAQAEPAARLARISEALEKLRATPSSAPAVAAVAATPAAPREIARDTTGSITAPAGAAALPLPSVSPAPAVSSVASVPPKQDAAHPPTVEGWVLRDVGHGGALIEGRNGLYEVYAGDPVPGLGRIDAIRKLDGRWVVVTSKGLIVAR